MSKSESETCTVFIVVDSATTFVNAFAPRAKDSHETVQCPLEWMDTFHCTPHSICADMVSSQLKFKISSVALALNLLLFSTGPYTPWPNRAEAAVRVFKATLHDLCAQIGKFFQN